MTKGELIEMLKSDDKPMNTEIEVYLECLNDDAGQYGELDDMKFDKHTKKLTLTGTYELDEF